MFVPSGIPAGLANLIQTNMLARELLDSLTVKARYRADATPKLLPPGTGQTLTFNQLGKLNVDLRPASAIGAVPRQEFSTEMFTMDPQPYKQAMDWDAPTAYAEVGDLQMQKVSRLMEWAARTSSRAARSKLFNYCGGQSIVRRAQTTADSVLLVNSLAGFRFAYINGRPTPVSSTTPLPITIKAAGDVFALVTGVTPLDADFPNGPGQLTLSAVLTGNVAAQSYVFPTGAQPTIIRPNNRLSSEALVAGDIPTLADILSMKSRLVDLGIAPHDVTGTYHLHVDAYFFSLITKDTAWRQAFQSEGLSPYFGAQSMWSSALGITILENNDSPALGKGDAIAVGSAGSTVGTTGTPGSSLSFRDNGIDVVSSTGVIIRRAIMTGQGVMIEGYVDQSKFPQLMGGNLIHKYNDVFSTYQIGGTQYTVGSVDRWVIMVRPPLDETAMVATVSVMNFFDFTLSTDREAISNTNDKAPLKKAVVLEYGSAA